MRYYWYHITSIFSILVQINKNMNHAPGAGSITEPIDRQSSVLPLYHGCPLHNIISIHLLLLIIYNHNSTFAHFPSGGSGTCIYIEGTSDRYLSPQTCSGLDIQRWVIF